MVSPLGFQEGGKKLTEAKNIAELFLTPDSTNENHVLRFLNETMIGVTEPIPVHVTEKATVVILDPT